MLDKSSSSVPDALFDVAPIFFFCLKYIIVTCPAFNVMYCVFFNVPFFARASKEQFQHFGPQEVDSKVISILLSSFLKLRLTA